MEAIEFANWLNNNWYVPTGIDSMWKVDVEHPEYEKERLGVPDVNLFTSEELFKKFFNK